MLIFGALLIPSQLIQAGKAEVWLHQRLVFLTHAWVHIPCLNICSGADTQDQGEWTHAWVRITGLSMQPLFNQYAGIMCPTCLQHWVSSED
jgi:hypothetical protein